MRIALTRRGLLYALAAVAVWVACYVIGLRDLWYLGALVTALVCVPLITVLILPLLIRAQVRVSLSDPTPAVGETLECNVRVQHALSSTLRARVVIEYDDERRYFELAAPARGSATLRSHWLVRRRGAQQLRVSEIRVEDPLGIAVAKLKSLGATATLLALPGTDELLARQLETRTSVGVKPEAEPSGFKDYEAGTPGGAMREYRSGDPLRQIHWKQSARQGQLLVNLHESGREQEHSLRLVDTPTVYDSADHFESAVVATATIASHWFSSGSAVRLYTTTERAGGPGTSTVFQHEGDLLRHLATLEPRTGSRTGSFATPAEPADIVVTGRVTRELEEEVKQGTVASVITVAPEPADSTQHAPQTPAPHKAPETSRRAAPSVKYIASTGIALLVIWAVTLFSFGATFTHGAWQWRALSIVLSVLIPATLIGMGPRRRRVLPVIVGALCGGLVWAWWLSVASHTMFRWREPAETLQQLQILILTEVAPLTPSGAFEDLLLLGVLTLAIISAALLLAFRAPVAAGASVALLLLAPVAITGLTTGWASLLALGVLLAFLAWIRSPRPNVHGLLAAGLALALSIGAMWMAPQPRDRIWNDQLLLGPLSTTVPDVTVALAEDLRARSQTRAFSYETSVPGAFRFTLATLSDFEGGRWQPQQTPNDDGLTISDQRLDLRVPPLTPESAQSVTDVVTIKIEGLLSPWLPLPQGVTQARAAGRDTAFDPADWTWEAGSNTAYSESALTRTGDTYRADSSAFSSDLLEGLFETQRIYERGVFDGPIPAVGSEESIRLYADASSAPEELQRYLALPGELPPAIAEAAAAASGDSADRLTLGVELQRWFRSGNFAYDERAPYLPGSDPDDPYAVMTALLEDRRGFCVHYASTFAVMARHLGAPTRLAIGYAVQATRSEGVVRGGDLHAWPEIFIDGLGWVAFEPTPGGAGGRGEGDGGDVGLDSAALDAESIDDTENLDETESESLAEVEAQQPSSEEPGSGGDSSSGTETGGVSSGAVILFGILAAALVAALAAFAAFSLPGLRRTRRQKQRLRAIGELRTPAQHAWDEFVETARDLGLLDTSRLAPGPRAQTHEAIVGYLRKSGVLTGTSAEAAQGLAEAAVAERYGAAEYAAERSSTERPAAEQDGTERQDPAGSTQLLSQLHVAVAGLKAYQAETATPTR